jgi:hypothetical protein
MRRFPKLFTRAGALPATVRRQLPPPRESARAQAAAFGRFGQRAEADVIRQIPADEGADSALASSPQPVLGVPGAGTTSYAIPLLDRAERLRGVFVALGGASRHSVWIPARPPRSGARRWTAFAPPTPRCPRPWCAGTSA